MQTASLNSKRVAHNSRNTVRESQTTAKSVLSTTLNTSMKLRPEKENKDYVDYDSKTF